LRYLWSASSDDNENVRTVHNDGDRNNNNPNKRLAGARPDLLLKGNEKVVTGKATIMFLKNGPV
jgi:hypothetical protein